MHRDQASKLRHNGSFEVSDTGLRESAGKYLPVFFAGYSQILRHEISLFLLLFRRRSRRRLIYPEQKYAAVTKNRLYRSAFFILFRGHTDGGFKTVGKIADAVETASDGGLGDRIVPRFEQGLCILYPRLVDI